MPITTLAQIENYSRHGLFVSAPARHVLFIKLPNHWFISLKISFFNLELNSMSYSEKINLIFKCEGHSRQE
jgi:hypothetical protein